MHQWGVAFGVIRNGGSDFYQDYGLMKKLLSKFEEPAKDEIDVWYINRQARNTDLPD